MIPTIKAVAICLLSTLFAGCSSVSVLPTDAVYTYANGFVTDRDNNVAFYYANGFVTRRVDSSVEKPIRINDDLQVARLTKNCYLYTAWADMGSWGRIGSNGLVVVSDGKALLIDSPTNESQTVELAWWFDKNMDVKLESFVPGHWHDDCVGGLPWLNRNGVKTYACDKTNHILTSKGLQQAKESFTDSLTLTVGKMDIQLYFLGGGHATDNIVAWIPSDKILFGGCMLKGAQSTSIGNTSDAAPLDEWLQTVERVEQTFPQAELIVPGHGEVGGKEILEATKRIITASIKTGK